MKRWISLTVLITFFSSLLLPVPKAQAQNLLGLPEPGVMVSLSPVYNPPIIRGLTVHKDNPFLFDFIVDVGQNHLHGQALKSEGEKLIKYFLASLAIPEKDLWVNLSPYEKDRTIPQALGETEMGRDLLAQDYILKQITASLIYPEKNLGKTFWEKVYAAAQEQFGTTQIPVNTFNKVWIMADKAEVFEHNQTVFVVKCHLKVMLEEDYLALTKHQRQPLRQPGDMFKSDLIRTCPQAVCLAIKPLNVKAPQGNHPNALPTTRTIASRIIKEIILPQLEREVNTGKNFANLRQICNSLILANWYKKHIKEALLNQVYSDKDNVKGIDLQDKTIKEQIYRRYLEAYKKGVFNYIKQDPFPPLGGEACRLCGSQASNLQKYKLGQGGGKLPRKYFSGGFADSAQMVDPAVITSPSRLRAAYAVFHSSFVTIKAFLREAPFSFEELPSEAKRLYRRIYNRENQILFSRDGELAQKKAKVAKGLKIDGDNLEYNRLWNQVVAFENPAQQKGMATEAILKRRTGFMLEFLALKPVSIISGTKSSQEGTKAVAQKDPDDRFNRLLRVMYGSRDNNIADLRAGYPAAQRSILHNLILLVDSRSPVQPQLKSLVGEMLEFESRVSQGKNIDRQFIALQRRTFTLRFDALLQIDAAQRSDKMGKDRPTRRHLFYLAVGGTAGMLIPNGTNDVSSTRGGLLLVYGVKPYLKGLERVESVTGMISADGVTPLDLEIKFGIPGFQANRLNGVLIRPHEAIPLNTSVIFSAPIPSGYDTNANFDRLKNGQYPVLREDWDKGNMRLISSGIDGENRIYDYYYLTSDDTFYLLKGKIVQVDNQKKGWVNADPKDLVMGQYVRVQRAIISQHHETSQAMITHPMKQVVRNYLKVPGGIDLNTSKTICIDRKEGAGVEMRVDQAMIKPYDFDIEKLGSLIARIKREGIDSLTPEIYSVTPLVDIWPLMGLTLEK